LKKKPWAKLIEGRGSFKNADNSKIPRSLFITRTDDGLPCTAQGMPCMLLRLAANSWGNDSFGLKAPGHLETGKGEIDFPPVVDLGRHWKR